MRLRRSFWINRSLASSMCTLPLQSVIESSFTGRNPRFHRARISVATLVP